MATLLGSASGSVELDISGAMKPADQLIGKFKELDSAGAAVGKSAGGMGAAAGKPLEDLDARANRLKSTYGGLGAGMVGVGVAIGAAFGGGIMLAANFDAAMSGVGASLGGVGSEAGITEDQFSALREEALRIGKDTAFSAGEAAAAMDVLAKAGVSTEDILGGTAQAAVDLAAAVGEDVPASAEAVSAAMSIFGPNVAQPLTDSADAADTFTAALNASQTDLTDFNAGLRNFGPAAALMGLGFEDVAGSIAYFTQFGLKGADVGVSLNAAISNLAKPTAEASELMTQYGISAFDASGKFVGIPAIMDQMQTAFSGVSDAERENAIRTIFGAEAYDVMAIAAGQGGDALRDMTSDMEPSGQAATQAAQRLDNLKGDVDALMGSLETLGIVLTGSLTGPLRFVTEAFSSFINVILGLPSGVQTAIAAVVGLTGAIALVGGGALLAAPKFLEMASTAKQIASGTGPASAAVRGLGSAFKFLGASLGPIAIAIAIIALLFLAYQTNFLGFRDLVNGIGTALANAFGPAVSKVIDVLKEIGSTIEIAVAWFQRLRDAGINPVSAAFEAVSMALKSIGGDMTPGWLLTIADLFHVAAVSVGKFVLRMTAAGAKITGAMKKIGKVFATDGLMAGFKELFGKSGQKLLAGFGDALSAPAKAVGDFFKGIETGIGPLDNVFEAIGQVATTFGRVIQEVFQGDIKGAITAVISLFSKWGQFGQAAFDLVGSALRALGDKFPVIGALMDGLASAFEAFGDIFRSIFEGDIPGILSGLGDLFGAMGDTALAALDLLWEGIKSGFESITDLPWGDIIAGAVGLAGRAFEFAGDIAVAAWNWFKDAISAIEWSALLEGARDLALVAFRLAGDIAVSAWNWFKAAIGAIPWSALLDGAKDLALVAFRLAGDIGAAAWNWFKDAIGAIPWSSILEGARDLASVAFRLAGDIGAAAWNWFKAAISAIPWSSLLEGAKDLASVAFRLAGDIGAAAWNWFKAAIGAIPWSSILEGARDLASVAFRLAGDLGAAAWTWFKAAIGAIPWSSLLEGARNLASVAFRLAGDIGEAAWTWFKDAIGRVTWSSLLDGATGLAQLAVDGFGTLGDKVTTWITDADLPAKGGDLIGGLFTGITNKWVEVDSWLGAMAGDIIATLNISPETLLAVGSDLLGGLFTGITNVWGEIDGWLAGLAEDVIATLAISAETLLEVGKTLLGGLWTGATFVWDNVIVPGAKGIVSALPGLLADTGGLLLEAGKALLAAVWQGATWVWDNTIVPGAKGIVTNLPGLLADAGGVLLGAGKAIAEAIWEGIKERATGWAQDIIDLVMSDAGTAGYGDTQIGARGGAAGGGYNPKSGGVGGGTKGLDAATASLGPAHALMVKMSTIDLSPLAANLGKVAAAMETVGGKTAAVTLADTAVRKLGTTSSAAATATASAFGRAAAAVASNSQRAANAVQVAANQITSRTSAMASAVTSNSQRAGNTLAQNLQSGASRATAAISSAAGTITGRIQSMSSAVSAAGAAAGNGLANGIQSGGGRAIGAAQSAASGIIGAFSGAASQAYSLGVSIGSGIGSGIGSQIGYIANQAANAVTTAIGAARQAAGNPQSPAPAMVDAVGDPLAEALWVPMKESTRKIQDTAAAAVAAAIVAARAAASSAGLGVPLGTGAVGLGGVRAPGGGAGAGSSSVQTVTYDYSGTTIQVSGAGDPRAVADAVLDRLVRGQSSVRRL